MKTRKPLSALLAAGTVLAGLAGAGANPSNKFDIFEKLMDSQTLVVTANTSTLYAYAGTDLDKDGPTVIEVPPGMLGFLDEMIQREPIEAIGPEVRGTIASIGIVKGKPFKPDARMKKLLAEAGTIGNATARAITSQPRIDGVFIYPDTKSSWSTAYANHNTSFEADGIMGHDARVLFYFNAGGVTPAMATSHVGAGSDYALAYLDANKKPFDGSKTYKVHLPPNVPVNDFWAFTMYDTQTRSMLQTGQPFPTVGSQDKGVKANADGSHDIYFGPKAPEGKEGNWLETVPGKSWFTILRMYGPLEPWIEKTWRPSEIELVK